MNSFAHVVCAHVRCINWIRARNLIVKKWLAIFDLNNLIDALNVKVRSELCTTPISEHQTHTQPQENPKKVPLQIYLVVCIYLILSLQSFGWLATKKATMWTVKTPLKTVLPGNINYDTGPLSNWQSKQGTAVQSILPFSSCAFLPVQAMAHSATWHYCSAHCLLPVGVIECLSGWLFSLGALALFICCPS